MEASLRLGNTSKYSMSKIFVEYLLLHFETFSLSIHVFTLMKIAPSAKLKSWLNGKYLDTQRRD
jgi:hypothetical protein